MGGDPITNPGTNTGDVVFIGRTGIYVLHNGMGIPEDLTTVVGIEGINDVEWWGINHNGYPHAEPPKLTKPQELKKQRQDFRDHLDRKLNKGRRWPR